MKMMFRPSTLILAFIVAFSLVACESDEVSRTMGGELKQNTSVPVRQAEQREYRVKPQGGGEDVVTLMLYFCGSDLESWGGAATTDLEEVLNVGSSENLNVIVETGGAYYWNNNYVNPDTNQRWQAVNGEMVLLEDAGLKNMSEGETLRDFITFSAENFPADRYMLVLWDHGGGTVDGYAYDERFGGDEMMPISELNQALAQAGVVFDMIGFDCCLMSTAETAFMVEKYADYMVASQRVEPSDGWYYTPWIQALSQNTSLPTLELGQIVVDSFISESSGGYYGNELTLAVTDLTYITDMFETMTEFFIEAEDTLIDDGVFISTMQALGNSRAITDNYDLVDLEYLISNMQGSDELLERLNQSVVYNNTTISDHNGLCLYFPYTDLSKVESVLEIYDQIGIDEAYQDFIATFANLMLGGQVYSEGGETPGDEDYFDSDFWFDLDWVDEQVFEENEEFYEEYNYDSSELIIDEKGDEFVLSMPDEDWELITDIEQRVFLDDGEGYVDLGSDAIYEFDDDGDLLISFDNTWVALNGELVCFYTVETDYEAEEGWYTWGVVPVLYDDRYAEIVVRWDSENPYGYVPGWQYTDTGTSSQKGLFDFKSGMTFDLLCDFYTYDMNYDDEYLWGEITVKGDIDVSYEDVGAGDCIVYYELYDVYCNSYWTEAVVFSL